MNTRKTIRKDRIVFENNTIDVFYKKIKNINLRIRTDGSISLSVPFHLKEEDVVKFLNSKKDWIDTNKSKFKKVKTIDYSEDDLIPYLGIDYFLQINITNNKQHIELDGEFLRVNIFEVNNNKNYIENFINDWYKENLYYILSDLNEIWADKMGLKYNEIKIRKMKSSWGICNIQKKIITYSLELAKKKRSLIEYVVVHELAHLIYNNHGKDFKALLDKLMPDWKIRRRELNNLY